TSTPGRTRMTAPASTSLGFRPRTALAIACQEHSTSTSRAARSPSQGTVSGKWVPFGPKERTRVGRCADGAVVGVRDGRLGVGPLLPGGGAHALAASRTGSATPSCRTVRRDKLMVGPLTWRHGGSWEIPRVHA